MIAVIGVVLVWTVLWLIYVSGLDRLNDEELEAVRELITPLEDGLHEITFIMNDGYDVKEVRIEKNLPETGPNPISDQLPTSSLPSQGGKF